MGGALQRKEKKTQCSAAQRLWVASALVRVRTFGWQGQWEERNEAGPEGIWVGQRRGAQRLLGTR